MRIVTAAALLLAATLAWAHGPTRQKVTETVTIAAAPEAVWARVRDFDKFHTWHPAVESSTTTDGSKVDSQRTLVLKGGGQIIESLEGFSDEDKRFSYRMKDAGPLEVANYTSTLSVKPGSAAGTTLVEWRGAFYRKYPGNDPPPDKTDEAAIASIAGIYKSGLANLKTILEKK
jgi:carbon monoxide dehydrogenase subunit G